MSRACSEILARHRARGTSKPRILWRCVRCSPVCESTSARLALLRWLSGVNGLEASLFFPVTHQCLLLSMVLILHSSLYLESYHHAIVETDRLAGLLANRSNMKDHLSPQNLTNQRGEWVHQKSKIPLCFSHKNATNLSYE